MLHNVSHISNKARTCGKYNFLSRYPLGTLFRQSPLRRDNQLQGSQILEYSTTYNSPPSALNAIPTLKSLEVAEDTIYALSTAPGRAGIAIVRISGPACLEIYRGLCPSKTVPKPRYASLRTLYDPTSTSGNILDSDALVLHFSAPKTVTGEDILELHIHGGPATVKAVLSAIPKVVSRYSIRYAEPGEFTRRAFQNNRLDLAQVESLSDTLSAETEQQRRAAVRGNSGNLGRTYEKWREQLLYARGELEALIDFSEDQHFDESPSQLLASVAAQVEVMLKSITQHEAGSQRGELLKRGIRISLLGPTNAGKSSLLNQIVGREASIVSQEAGTTRDIVEVSLDLRGYLCTFADTAGLRTNVAEGGLVGASSIVGAVEQEGIRRAKAKAGESDIVIALASVESSNTPEEWTIRFDAETLLIARQAPHYMVVINKCDSVTPELLSRLLADFRVRTSNIFLQEVEFITISCRDAQVKSQNQDPGNIHHFVNQLAVMFTEMTTLPTDLADLLGVTERQRQLLATCSEALLSFIEEAHPSESRRDSDIVLAAEHLRGAANSLSRITGRGEAGDVEEVLGVVFEKFCVGK